MTRTPAPNPDQPVRAVSVVSTGTVVTDPALAPFTAAHDPAAGMRLSASSWGQRPVAVTVTEPQR